MFRSTLLRQVSRASTTAIRPPTSALAAASPSSTTTPLRFFTTTPSQKDKKPLDPTEQLTTAGEPGASEHEGRFARTDESFTFEHPDEPNMPSSAPVQGRGHFHFRRTLASFSLEEKVGLVTGGARGLGLVMSQALHLSGADVAIVDLNSTLFSYIHCHSQDAEGDK